MIQKVGNLLYEDILKHLNLYTQEWGRVRGDLIEVYKLMTGFNKVDVNKDLVVKDPDKTRSNGF